MPSEENGAAGATLATRQPKSPRAAILCYRRAIVGNQGAGSLPRYTHRVAISNRRTIALDGRGVTFRFKNYRRDGAERYQTMTLAVDEFIRRFLLHVLPKGVHRIRHYGLLAAPQPAEEDDALEPSDYRPPCPCCGGRMIVIETFERCNQPRAPPAPPRSAGRTAP
jgi:hypothetical protein